MALKEPKSGFQQRDLVNMNIANIRVSSNDLPVRRMFHDGPQFGEKFYLSPDDGYSTDSRSNTTASIHSPLSSSLSSLTTSEGSPHSGTIHLSTSGSQNCGQKLSQMQNLQPGPIQKGANLHVASKTLLSRNGMIPVKRKGVKAEEPNKLSSLEDRLRALTTIDEEDLGFSTARRAVDPQTWTEAHRAVDPHTETEKLTQNMKSKNVSSMSYLDTRHSEKPVEGQRLNPDPRQMSGYYQAVPVAVTTGSYINPHDSVAERSEHSNSAHIGNVYNQLQSDGEWTKEGWGKYTGYFNKQSETLSKNINESGPRKVSNKNVSSLAITGSENHPRIDSSRLHTGQEDPRVGVEKYDEYSQYLEDQHRLPDGGFHSGSDTNGYHRHDNDSLSKREYRMSYIPSLPSYDPSLVHDIQGSPPHTQTYQYGSHLYKQTQHNYMYQQKPNQELGVADQYANIQASHSYKQDNVLGIALEHSYLSQGYPSPTQNFYENSSSSNVEAASRASWQQLGCSFDQQHLSECRKLTQVGLERNSLDLGNIPKLQKQIRAVSDLCLLASRKHTFASSADIHKLFSGQKKQLDPIPNSASTNDHQKALFCDPGHRWSHSGVSRTEALPVAQDSFQQKPQLQVIIPPPPATGKLEPVSDPFQADHIIHIPPEAWIDVTSVPSFDPPRDDRVYIHLQNETVSPQSNPDRFVSGDFSTDRTQANCQSSGYSSESELQQIESNAEAIKKLLKTQTMEKVTHYQVHKFQPSQQFSDNGSNMESDRYIDGSVRDNVYENQFIHSSYFQPPDLQNSYSVQQSSAFSSTAYSTLESHIPAGEQDSQTRSSRNSSFKMFTTNSDLITHNNNIGSLSYNQKYSVYAQQEAYDLRNNSTFTDLTRPDSHTDQPPLQHTSGIQAYNCVVNQNQQIPPQLISYGSRSLPPPQHAFPHVPSSCSCKDCHTNSQFYPNNEQWIPHVYQPQSQSSHLDYPQINGGSSFSKLPSQEMVHMLIVPFETNVVCSEQGNQLSTLV